MTTRYLYLVFVALFAYLLFFSYTSEQKQSKEESLSKVSANYKDSELIRNSVLIQNDSLEIYVDPASGNVVSSSLKKYPLTKGADTGVRVFGKDVSAGFEFYLKTGFTGLTNEEYKVENKGDDFIVLSSGLVKKKISIVNDYELLIKDDVVNQNSSPGRPYAAMYRTDERALDGDDGFISNSSFLGVAFNTEDDPYDSYRFRSIDSQEFKEQGGWVALIQKYFMAALIGGKDYYYTYFAREPANQNGLYSFGYSVDPLSGYLEYESFTHRVFVGPKTREDLLKRAPDLELAIDMGWFWFLAQPLSSLLNFINSFVGNWGVSIIILTALIKILFWPLTGMGFRSMGKMRAITPELKSIQDRYKNDRQKLSSEMMALYKREGVNPLGGCFPLLASFPFFIALFFVLRESLELRHAPFAFWLTDLSAPDPFFVLPLVMALLMFLTTKLNPTPPNADPTQMMVMKFMPVGISIIFIFFPSGLVLYSVANSGIQLIQQTLLYREVGGLKN